MVSSCKINGNLPFIWLFSLPPSKFLLPFPHEKLNYFEERKRWNELWYSLFTICFFQIFIWKKIHNDFVTHENKDFVKETIHDKYGEPKTIHGVETYPNPVDPNRLLKVQLNAKQREFIPKERRCGVIARKIGVMPLWNSKGEVIMSTLLHVEDNHVISYTPPEHVKHNPEVLYPKNHGCLVVGACSTDPFKFTKEYCDLFKYAGVMPKQHLGRFFITPNAKILPGTPLNVTHFRVGDYVDVAGFT